MVGILVNKGGKRAPGGELALTHVLCAVPVDCYYYYCCCCCCCCCCCRCCRCYSYSYYSYYSYFSYFSYYYFICHPTMCSVSVRNKKYNEITQNPDHKEQKREIINPKNINTNTTTVDVRLISPATATKMNGSMQDTAHCTGQATAHISQRTPYNATQHTHGSRWFLLLRNPHGCPNFHIHPITPTKF